MISNVNHEQTVSEKFPDKVLSVAIKSSVMNFSYSISKDSVIQLQLICAMAQKTCNELNTG